MGAKRKREEETVEDVQESSDEEQESASDNEPSDEAENTPVDPLVGSGVNSDPYLLEEVDYIKKEHRCVNKQRVLLLATRGIDGRNRHLLKDLGRLMPHHKTEPKFDKNANFGEISEVAEMKSCNSVVFLESRKDTCYLHMARVPHGPTLKFALLNVHTCSEVKMSGNCLMGSRPLLTFDEEFDRTPHMRLTKEMMTQVFGVPRNHPKSKPFYDHVMSFHYLDNKIWLRHYQISPETEEDHNVSEKQQLTEIGPRLVLNPVVIQSGAFGGKILYSNPKYMTPVAARRQKNIAKASKWRERTLSKAKGVIRREDNPMPADELEDVFE